VLFQSYLCATYPIQSSWLKDDNLPRSGKLSPEQFESRFDVPNRPVVFPGTFQRAQRNWTWEHLREVLVDKDMQVGMTRAARRGISLVLACAFQG
jgi:hypothetical protein